MYNEKFAEGTINVGFQIPWTENIRNLRHKRLRRTGHHLSQQAGFSI